MNGNSKFNAPNCAVQVNSKDNKGMTQEGHPTAVGKRFGVSGAHTGDGYSTPPKDGAEAVKEVAGQGVAKLQIKLHVGAQLRYAGSDTALGVKAGSLASMRRDVSKLLNLRAAGAKD